MIKLETLKTLSEEQRFGMVFSSTSLLAYKHIIVKGFVRQSYHSDMFVYDMTLDTSDKALQSKAPVMLVRNRYHAHFLQFCLSHNLTVE